MLITSRIILWLKMVISISKIIFNHFPPSESFPPFLFFVQIYLFPGYVHGSMIITSKTSIYIYICNYSSVYFLKYFLLVNI